MGESKLKENRDKEVILRKVAAIATITASTITIIIGALTIGNYVPKVIFEVFLILTLLIILVLLVYVFARILRKWKEARKNKALVKKYFDDFAAFSDRLAELLKDNRCDNIPYVFTHLRNMPAEFNNLRSSMYDTGSLFAVFKNGIKKFHKRDLRLLIKWFESILRMYNSQLVLQPFRQIRNFYRDKLTEDDKEAYEKSRENYVRFLQDYMNFARAINKSCGEKKVAQDYFEQPGRL